MAQELPRKCAERMVINTLIQDLRHAVRGLWKTPLFTAVAVTSIALGIGANAAVFTLLDQVVLRLLPVRSPQALVQVRAAEGSETYGGGMGDGSEMSYAMFQDLRDHNRAFDGMFARFVTSSSSPATTSRRSASPQ